jgi:hypothetical protein
MDKKDLINAFKKVRAQKARFSNYIRSYDNAAFHSEEVEKLGLDKLAAFLHSGIVLAWAADKDLLSIGLKAMHPESINELKQNKLSPA